MISKSDKSVLFIPNVDKLVQSLGNERTPDWAQKLRAQGLSRFTELGLPTTKDEEWKYTNVSGLNDLKFSFASTAAKPDKNALEQYLNREDINLVFINGILSKEYSNVSAAPAGITISTLPEALASNPQTVRGIMTRYAVSEEAAFVALNEALNNDGAFIDVKENTVSKKVIHILHVTCADGKNLLTMPRTLINLRRSAEITVLESHLAFDDGLTYLSNALTDVELAENAVLHYAKTQKESLSAYHVGHTRVWQERNARFDGFSLMTGAKLTRNDLDVVLNGEGGDATINALYSVRESQHVDNHTSVDHRVPNCTSNQLYKGILNQAARAVFNGKIFVKPIAQQTNSYQLNKNLLLGKECRVDTKPQLEIFADDVKCTHGATIGQLDEDELFYLQTRCISRKNATKMLVHGFADGLLSTIQNESIRRRCHDLIQPSLEVLG